MSESLLVKNPVTRLLFQIGAIICIILGVLGIFLPLLPTTPFLLLSAWLSLRSSPKIHDWLIQHPKLGPPLQRYLNDHSISPQLCKRSLLTLWLGISVSILLVNSTALKVMLLAIACCSTFYLLKLVRK